MTFRDITLKNMKANVHNYFSYFFSSAFSVMLFFIYSTLLFNETILNSEDYKGLSKVFIMSMFSITVFAIFFINYAHSAFIKSRNKEFGVYMTLGMTQKDLRKIMRVESFALVIASLITGVLTGALFSRLFQMVVIKILDIDSISYDLNYKPFLLTIFMFTIIFFFNFIRSSLYIRKLDISELLKEARKSESVDKHNKLTGLIGIGLLLIAFILLIVISGNEELVSNGYVIGAYVLILYTGAYFTISGLSGSTIYLIKRSNLYYRNILFISELNHKIRQNRKIIFVLSILCSIIMVLCTFAFVLYNSTEESIETNQPNAIEFVQIGSINKISEDTLNTIISNSNTPLVKNSKAEFLSLFFQGKADPSEYLHSKPVMSEDIYNSVTGNKVSVPEGKALSIKATWEWGSSGVIPNENLQLSDGTNNYSFTGMDFIDNADWPAAALVYPSKSGIVLNNKDYAEIKSKINADSIGTYYLLDFKDWRKTKAIIDGLEAAIDTSNQQNLSQNSLEMAKLFPIMSRLGTYEVYKKGYAMFIFIITFIGMLFLIAYGSVLYLKQFTEINSAKEKFYRLYRIGVHHKEISSIISKELLLTFFSPLLIGGILGYSLLYIVSSLADLEDSNIIFLTNFLTTLAISTLFQVVFYFLARRKYVNEILKGI